MDKKTKAFIYNLLGFAVFFIVMRFWLLCYTNLNGIWKPLTAAIVASLLAPKFQAVKTRDGVKIFMKALFIRGVKEVG